MRSPPPRRYEHEAPGDMVHLDIKKLRNFNEEGIRNAENGNRHKSANKAAGTQCMHVAVDVHTRYATVSVLEDETAESATARESGGSLLSRHISGRGSNETFNDFVVSVLFPIIF